MRKLMPFVMVVTLLFVVAPYVPVSFAQDTRGTMQTGDGVASTPTPTPDPETPPAGAAQSTSDTSESEADYLDWLVLNGLLALF